MPIKILAAGKKRAEVLIHEPIGENWYGDGLTSKRFLKELAGIGDVDEILVRINSPGGAVFDSIAIYNALKAHGAKIEVLIEGLAASGASVIAMAGEKIKMGIGAKYMIHNPWTFAMGDAQEMREIADVLDDIGESLLDIYEDRTGQDRGDLKAMMDAETWLGTAAAIEKGFADESDGEEQETDDEKSKAAFLEQIRALGKKYRVAADMQSLRVAASIFKSAPADAIRSDDMTKEVASALTADDVKNAEKAAVLAARKAETQRRADIRSAFGKFADKHRALLDACLDDIDCSADTAREKLLAKLGEGAAPVSGSGVIIEAGTDEREKFIAGGSKALLARAGIEKPEAGNEFNGMGLADMAAHSLTRIHVAVRGLTRNQIAGKILAAMTTSDFPQLLSNTAGKMLRKAYGEFPHTYSKWAAIGSVSDFKVHPRIQLGSFGSLATIVEGGEVTYTSATEDYENAQALTKGKAIRMTRQMLVNDDLGAFITRAQMMGRAAARTVNTDAYAYLTSGSSSHGPTSTDTGQFFNATAVTTAGGHANLTSSGTAISVTSIGVGRAAMRKQKDKGLNQTLNIEPKILVCSVLKEDLANEVVKSRTKDGQSNPELINVHQNRVEVVSDPTIDGVNSGTRWYLFANPLDVPAFEVVFLDGVREPFIDEKIDFHTDSLDLKTRLDYGVGMGDWRGGYSNVGA
jgi:ATP-dependent protease ClpP protease subunit